jgi:hypothetical protein
MTAAHLVLPRDSVGVVGRRGSGDPQHDRDDHPDAYEAAEDPEQECSFADREPGEMMALEKELAPTKNDAGRAAFNDLAADGGGRVVGDVSLGVKENARAPGSAGSPGLVLSHELSLARFTSGLTSLRGERS